MKEDDKMKFNFDNTYNQLPPIMYSKINLNKTKSPKIVLINHQLAQDLDIDSVISNNDLDILCGCKESDGSINIAQAYCGHQFGFFNTLGDGRAVLLGEHITNEGLRYDVHLKGSGKTPYSRSGDGLATLSSMLREYIISEAMNGLGVPTTRSLAVVTTGEKVVRPISEEGAVLTRIAKSHIRVGTFEFALVYGGNEVLKRLADYTMKRHFPNLDNGDYLGFLRAIIDLQAKLIAKWQSIGFVHGVMNTDNMCISGETIDYGPCAFLNIYEPDTSFSSIDTRGRYSYKNQPNIALWNLTRFSETLLSLFDDDTEKAKSIALKELNKFNQLLNDYCLGYFSRKIGLEKDNFELVEELLGIMKEKKLDFTNTFRLLSDADAKIRELHSWCLKWNNIRILQSISLEESNNMMQENNPYVIPRNYRVDEIIKTAVNTNDFTEVLKIVEILRNPFDYLGIEDKYLLDFKDNNDFVTYCGT